MSIDEQIYNNFQKIYVLLDDGDRRALSQAQLAPAPYNLLRHLQDVDQGLSVTTLANKLLCTRGNVTRMVQRLQKQNLVQTTPDKSDGRRIHITLTHEGQTRLNQAKKHHQAAITRRLDRLDNSSRQQLLQLTQQVSQLLEDDLNQQAK